ncbi:MAG: hypothetical protein HGB32_07865 [Geobacteraceae bacterium]|nr:hypothetical protein [Geobacteraceae bacterium]
MKIDSVQRLQGLVSELSFEKFFSQKVFSEKISYGWFSKVRNSTNDQRDWYKVAVTSYNLSDAEKKLVDKLSRNGHRFFIIHPTISIGSPPGIKLELTQYMHGRYGAWPKVKNNELVRRTESLEKKIVKKLKEFSGKISKKEGKDWLITLAISDLEILFATRCLLDFGIEYATDVDGIYYDSAEEKLNFIEFKRKDPAHRYFSLLNTSTISQYRVKSKEYSEILIDRIRLASGDEIERLRSQQEQEINNKLNDSTVWNKTVDECFGLDLSHITNVELCEKNSIKYNYVIWNHSRGKLNTLFDMKFKPKDNPEVLLKVVAVEDLRGMHFTIGKKSGSFTDDPRFQMMIPKDLFTECKINYP